MWWHPEGQSTTRRLTLKDLPEPTEAAASYVDRYASKLDFSGTPPPSLSAFRQYLARVGHSAPEHDGLPFEARRRAGPAGERTLYEGALWLQDGGLLNFDFNAAAHVFIRKKVLPGDCTEIIRAADDVRTIGCKNTDNKTMGGVCNCLLWPVVRPSPLLRRH